MTAERTITESELAKAASLIPLHLGAVKPEELRHALDRIGIETVPDPMPEPEGDVVLMDRDGTAWFKTISGSGWAVAGERASAFGRNISDLHEKWGPLKVYRAEEVAPDGR